MEKYSIKDIARESLQIIGNSNIYLGAYVGVRSLFEGVLLPFILPTILRRKASRRSQKIEEDIPIEEELVDTLSIPIVSIPSFFISASYLSDNVADVLSKKSLGLFIGLNLASTAYEVGREIVERAKTNLEERIRKE
jgi:hypothetical protein